MKTIHVYTDGACSGNPGPMGIGCVIFDEGDDGYDPGRVEISEFLGEGTNQRAELLAVDAGLLAVLRCQGSTSADKVVVYSDSEYAIGLLSKGWRAKANQDLVAAVRKTCLRLGNRLSFVKIKGHSGVVENERCDELATAAIRRGRK